MSLLQKYIQELEEDVRLDELNLKGAALTLPGKKAKWVSRLMLEKSSLIELNKKKEKTLNLVIEEIKKESPVKLTYPTLKDAAERHSTVADLILEMKEKESVIEFLERVDKTIHSIGFDIKNLIELIKMETT
jgi:hypothetical protein